MTKQLVLMVLVWNFLNLVAHSICHSLAYFCDPSLYASVFSVDWKTAKVTVYDMCHFFQFYFYFFQIIFIFSKLFLFFPNYFYFFHFFIFGKLFNIYIFNFRHIGIIRLIFTKKNFIFAKNPPDFCQKEFFFGQKIRMIYLQKRILFLPKNLHNFCQKEF